MAFFEVSTDLIQKVGEDLYRINLSTLASLVRVTDKDGAASNVQKEIDALRELTDAIGDSVSGNAHILVKPNIADRDALTDLPVGTICYVTDASADSTVDSGAASYLWNGTSWEKLSEFESLDLILEWANITDKPEVLDKLGEEDGHLTYDGKKVGVDNGAVFKVTVTGDNPDYSTAIAALGEIPDNSAIFCYRDTPVSVTRASVPQRNKSFSLRRK